MFQANLHPSADDLLAIAKAGESFADALSYTLSFCDEKPDENPVTILVNRCRQAADPYRKAEYVDDLSGRCLYFIGSLRRLHQLLIEVWPSYLCTLDKLDSRLESWSRKPADRVEMPERAIAGWRFGIVLALRGLQRDLGDFEDVLSKAALSDAQPPKHLTSIALVDSLQRSSRDLRQIAENERTIPPEDRTIPMSYRKAAQLMGKGDSQDAAEWLSKSVAEGSIPCEHITRQNHVFSRTSFPNSVWPQIMPK